MLYFHGADGLRKEVMQLTFSDDCSHDVLLAIAQGPVCRALLDHHLIKRQLVDFRFA